MFWPDSDLDAGRASLRTALASLRRQLEPPGTPTGSVLIADFLHVRLNPASVLTDTHIFEAALKSAAAASSQAGRQVWLRRAVEACTGDLLPGFYDDWALTERERFTRLYEETAAECASFGEARERLGPAPIAITDPDLSKITPDLFETAASRLPLQWTQFFGRERERAQIAGLLTRHRLVTLSGIGGAGKTRLAVIAARDSAPLFGSALFFVPLADLSAPR